MSDSQSVKVCPKKRHCLEWNTIAVIAATIAVLFLFTRSAPFPAGTFWELTIARDFDLNIHGAIFPEQIALKIVDSAPSWLTLKAIYHIAFFLLCCIACFWIFKSREVMPGIIFLAVFALSMESFLNLRTLLFLIFTGAIFTLLNNKSIEGAFGWVLIPIIGASAGLTLNCWLLLVLVACHVFYNKSFRLTVFGCALIGLMLFPEGAALSVNPDAFINRPIMPEADIKLMYLVAGMFLIINLASLKRLSYDDLPNLFFYAVSGFAALFSSALVPLFVFTGLFIAIRCFADIEPLSMSAHLFGIMILTVIIHIFLFLNPFGFKLNTSVRGQLGNVAPIIGQIDKEPVILNHEIGELAWKGFVRVGEDDIKKIYSCPAWRLVKSPIGDYLIEPQPSDSKLNKMSKSR